MSVTVVIQARMGSTRLPGKVAAQVAGRPMLAFMLERLAPLRSRGEVLVATSDQPADDVVAAIASDAGVRVVRGPEQDVLARFGLAMRAAPSEMVVRLTADCPLADPVVVQDVVDHAAAATADYTSNTLQRTFPDGLDVEVLRTAALQAAVAEAVDPAEREHVTPFVYRRPQRFVLAVHCSGSFAGHERWTVDTADDLDWVRSVVDRLPDWRTAPWREILQVAGARTPPANGRHLRPVCSPGRLTERKWEVLDGDRVTGEALVHVIDGGVATWSFVGTDPIDDVEALVRRALGDDLQVVRLQRE